MEASTILDDLDRRQNQVLEELDALNARIEALLKEHIGERREKLDHLTLSSTI